MVTGFVTDMEDGFKTHGHFATTTQEPSLLPPLLTESSRREISIHPSLLFFTFCSLLLLSLLHDLSVLWLLLVVLCDAILSIVSDYL